MKFIAVTEVDVSPDGVETRAVVILNVDHIVSIEPGFRLRDHINAVVRMSRNGTANYVEESVDEIMTKIAQR